MNPVPLLLAFVLGLGYGGVAGKTNIFALLAAALALSVLLGSYPFYDDTGFSTVFAASIIGAVLRGWVRK